MNLNKRNEQIKQDFLDGLTTQQVAEKFGLSNRYTRAILKEMGVNVREIYNKRCRSFSEEKEKEIVQEYESGLTTYDLAKKYGHTNDLFRKIIHRHDGNMRKPSQRNGKVVQCDRLGCKETEYRKKSNIYEHNFCGEQCHRIWMRRKRLNQIGYYGRWPELYEMMQDGVDK